MEEEEFLNTLAQLAPLFQQETGRIFGYEPTIDYETGVTQFEGLLLNEPVDVPIYGEVAITEDDTNAIVGGLSDKGLKDMAMDMFLNAEGAYGNIDDVFNEDGSVNMGAFTYALERTKTLAELQLGTGRTDFLDILQRDSDLTPEEISTLFREREAELNKKPERIINYIDPAALKVAASDAFSQVTGRKATDVEIKAFIKKIHGLQASGVSSISVGAQAGEFARGAAPVEAGAMDHVNAASLIMQAAGIGGRR